MGWEEQQIADDRAALANREHEMSVADRSSAHLDIHNREFQARNNREHEMRGSRAGGLGYSSRPFDLKGNLALVAMVAAGLVVIGMFIVPITWWMGAGDSVRSTLEASPLSGGVAESANGGGNPGLVGGVIAGLVVAALVAVSVWRRRLAARAVLGEVHRAALFGVSLLRTLILVFGATLVPVAASIAAGNDLKPDSDTTALTDAWPIAIVVVGVLGYTLISSGKRWEAAIKDPPPAGPPAE